MSVHVWAGIHVTSHLCGGQRAWYRSWFFLPCGSQVQTQVVRLGSKCLTPLSHLIKPSIGLSSFHGIIKLLI